MTQQRALDVRAISTHRRPSASSTVGRKASALSSSGANALIQRVGNRGIQTLLDQVSGQSPARDSHLQCAIQAKLTISQPGDTHEQEADRVADAVMRMPAPVPSRQSAFPVSKATSNLKVQRLCAECDDELSKKSPLGHQSFNTAGAQIQRAERAAAMPQVTPSAAANLQAMRGGGRPLPAETRAFFEPRFGTDFSHVRVHTGTQADEAAKSIGAKAFTMGRDIGFSRGQFAPESIEGRHLLAHELTHTIQQGASSNASVAGVQRVCEVTPPPADLGCREAVSSVGSGTPILFALDSPGLSATARGTLSAIAAAWHRGGGIAVLRIDGFASCEGAADLNWRLSCQRAQAVAAELEAPSDGSPGVDNRHIEIFANGETDQFSATNLPPNRRVVITDGGVPPPGPACPLTITGPDEVDHYCAAYVPSDAAACGVFPAPDINLTVAGAAPGATLRWSITRGTARATIAGANTGPTVRLHGDAASAAQGDVIVQVTDGACTATHFLTVREPSQMTDTQVPTVTPNFVQTVVTYTVRDQFGNPMGAGICVDETVTLCRTSHPGPMAFGDGATNAAGQVIDNLSVGPGIPAGFCRKFNQTLTAGGCGPLLRNTLTLQNSGITLTHGAGCTPGAPCP